MAQRAVVVLVLVVGVAEEHGQASALGLGHQTREPVGGPPGAVVLAALLQQGHHQAAGHLGIAGAQGALPLGELDLPALRHGQPLRPQPAEELAVAPFGEDVDEEADGLGDEGRAGIAGRDGGDEARRHFGMAHAVVVHGQTVTAVKTQSGSGVEGLGEGLARLVRPAQTIEEVAAQDVEAQAMGGVGAPGQLLIDPRQGLLRLAGELQLHQLWPGIRDGDGERESESSEHPERPRRRRSDPG